MCDTPNPEGCNFLLFLIVPMNSVYEQCPWTVTSNSAQHSTLSQVCHVHSYAHIARCRARCAPCRALLRTVARGRFSVTGQRRFVARAFAVPTSSPIATYNLFRDTSLSKLCSDREFSVAIENHENPVSTGNPPS